MGMTAELRSEPLLPVCAEKKRSVKAMEATNTGSSLDDLVIKVDESDDLRETRHMQPQLMELLYGVQAFKQSAVQIHDTHSGDPIQQPAAQVDCSLLASDLRRWTSMVVPVEFKLEDSELPTAVGQLVNRVRLTLQQQPDRMRVFGVAITMKSIEVFQFTRLRSATFKLQRSGAQVQTLTHLLVHPGCALYCEQT